MRVHAPDPSPLQEKFRRTRQELSDALIERDEDIDVVLTALICQEHPLLVGPPGTAKSLLLDALARWLDGRRFTILLTRFSQPEELFGPISLSALREDRFLRVTTGKLPEAELVYLDEIWKASSAIINCLLRLLNERVFDAGDGILRPVPLKICVASANEWPQPAEGGRELEAAFDRFLFRKTVRPIASLAGRQRLLWVRDHTPTLSTSITAAELDQAWREALTLPWSDDGRQALETVLHELFREGIQPGDRRQFRCVAACQAFAYLQGDVEVRPEHLEIAQHVLWGDPIEQPARCAQVIARIANPVGMRVNQLLLEAEEILAATDCKDLAQAATATAKLAEIERQLAALRADARVERARTHVRDGIRRLKVASIEAIA